MKKAVHTSGKISLKRAGQKRYLKHISFKMENKPFSVSETLMCEFDGLDLSDEEKSKLSRPLRENMCSYLHACEKEIKSYRRDLINQLKQYKDEPIVICASEMGALICLAAIYSGELPQNVSWKFELKEFAPRLFPKELIKKESAAHSYDICLAFSKEGWIRPFPTLCRAPTYMGLRTNIDHEELAA